MNKLEAADAGAAIDEQNGEVAHRREPSDSAGRRWSLAGRLAVWYTLSTFVLVLGSIGFLYWGLVETLEREDDQYLVDKARVLFGVLHERHGRNPSTAVGEHDGRRGELLDEWRRELAEEVERETGARTPGAFHLRAIGRDGTVLIESAGMADSLPASIFPPPIALDDRRPQAKERTSAAGRAYRVLAFRDHVVDRAAAPEFIVQVAMDRTAEEQLLAAYRWYVGAAVALALFGCGWVGRLLVRRGLSPLNSIVAASNRIRSTTLDQRLPLDGLPVELASLAESLNQMFDRLEDSFRRLERFSGDIAHEMRTPLNNLRGAVEVSLRQPRALDEYRELLGSSLEEFGRLSDLIDSLLFLARADNPREQLALRSTVVANELLAVCEFYDAAAQEVGVELRGPDVVADSDSADAIVAPIDSTLFRRAVSNLIANAIAHTPRGGCVSVEARRVGPRVSITVSDTGVGIAPEHLPHVFERFYRADSARQSHGGNVGLGLPLVKTIAKLHGGGCSIRSEVGQGTRVELDLPACDAAAV